MREFLSALVGFIVTAVCIALCLGVGHIFASVLGVLPASLYGMLLFAALLATGLMDEERLGKSVARIVYYMPIVFLPICVGVMEYTDLIASVGWKLLLIGVLTTLLTMSLIAFVASRMLPRESDD